MASSKSAFNDLNLFHCRSSLDETIVALSLEISFILLNIERKRVKISNFLSADHDSINSKYKMLTLQFEKEVI